MLFDIAALAATQIIFCLYGAGVRRPFGSLRTVVSLPKWLRFSRWIVVVDCLFVFFIAVMWVLLISHIGIWMFLGLGLIFFMAAESLTYRISILPSFYVSGALACLACFWMTQRVAPSELSLLAGGN